MAVVGWKVVLLKDTHILMLETVSVTFLGKKTPSPKIFAGVIIFREGLEMGRLSGITQVGSKYNYT